MPIEWNLGRLMSVRFKLALTIFATGMVTALLVIATVLYAFMRFEREVTFQRASSFLMRITSSYDVLELRRRQPVEFNPWLRNLVLYEPDTQLYLLDADGAVLANTGKARLAPGFKVALGPVLAAMQSAKDDPRRTSFVMGDDPERMDADAVVAAEPLRAASPDSKSEPPAPTVGYLYLVAHRDGSGSRWEALRSTFALPSLALIAGIVALTTLLAALVIASVTRPLRRLTDAVATLSEKGLEEGSASATQTLLPRPTPDEFGQLTSAFEMMLATLRRQWGALRRLDHFRREGVSNLSHDLRSPLTATAACLETLGTRWSGDPLRADDQRLLEIALRNTRNAGRLVQSLGDLAKLDEPEFGLRPVVVDLGELLDDICIRFAERASTQHVTIRTASVDGNAPPVHAAVDVELFERAIANLIDNALKFCPSGSIVELAAVTLGDAVCVSVRDDGPGISPADLPYLFDRFFQSRQSVAPATGEGGKGLGLAIVKRIVELHGGEVKVSSEAGHGTRVDVRLPLIGP
ncbi:MAG: HAMP domain-containing sensor histidine kinase [Caldimonas sp.]